jgi:hypothetical protein
VAIAQLSVLHETHSQNIFHLLHFHRISPHVYAVTGALANRRAYFCSPRVIGHFPFQCVNNHGRKHFFCQGYFDIEIFSSALLLISRHISLNIVLFADNERGIA